MRGNAVPRLTLFLKGNIDVHDTLHSCRIGGEICWNGINEVLRERRPGTVIRLRHEIGTRSDALLAATGVPPRALREHPLPLGRFTMAAQFSTALFTTDADAIVLSVQPDVSTGLVRHRTDGFLFYPCDYDGWPAADRDWLRSHCAPVPLLDTAASTRNLEAIVRRIRAHSDVPILIFNVSPIVPGETVHCFQGLGETFATRVRRLNLGLVGISERTGISIIDVDSIIARAGADGLKHDGTHLTPQGYRLVAEEVVRVLDDLGLFATEREAACAPA